MKMPNSTYRGTQYRDGAPGSAFFVHYKYRRFCLFLILILVSGISVSYAQPEGDIDLAPPPLRMLSKDERSRLDAMTDIKKRTQLALELMGLRLTRAETANLEERHDGMFEELGGFHGLMDNTLAFLDRSNRDSNKVLSNYKRFEIGLRQFRPRLEIIRRDLPRRYENYVRILILYVRDARTKAVEPLFGETVVPNRKP